MWARFDDLPEELAKALLEKNLYELICRPIQRPFGAEELAELVAEIREMDPATAVCDWTYADFCDPYRLGDVPHVQVGREEFVKASGDRWVSFGDLPTKYPKRTLRCALNASWRSPAGLEFLWPIGGQATDKSEESPPI